MAIRSHQIGGVTLYSAVVCCFAPGKGVHGKAQFTTRCGEFVRYRSVNMQLPVKRSKWGEVVLRTCPDPGQAIAAMHLPCFPLTERAIGIVNPHLRDDAKQRMPAQREARGCRHK